MRPKTILTLIALGVAVSSAMVLATKSSRTQHDQKQRLAQLESTYSKNARELENLTKSFTGDRIESPLKAIDSALAQAEQFTQKLAGHLNATDEDLRKQTENAVAIAKDVIRGLSAENQDYSTSKTINQVANSMSEVAQLLRQKTAEPKQTNVLGTATAVIGIIGGISTMLLTWRGEARERLKLEIELAKLKKSGVEMNP